MVALTKNKSPTEVDGTFRELPVEANAKIFAGAMVMIGPVGSEARHAALGATAPRVVGVAWREVDNTGGADGDVTVTVKRGVFLMANDSTNTLSRANIGQPCYVEDNQTVGSLATSRPIAGTVFDVTPQGVWVRFN